MICSKCLSTKCEVASWRTHNDFAFARFEDIEMVASVTLLDDKLTNVLLHWRHRIDDCFDIPLL